MFFFSQADFYYTTNNEKEFFHTVTGKWSVEFYDTITNYPNTKIAEQFSIVTDTSDLSLFSTNYRVNPLYITQTGGVEMVLTSNIIVHFNENVTNQEKQNLINQYGLRNVESNNIYDLYSCDSVIETAKRIYAGTDKNITLGEGITLSATEINEEAIYNWYDSDENFIYTGIDFL